MRGNVLPGRGRVVLLALTWFGLHAQDSAVAQTSNAAEREVIESLMACQQAWQAEDLEAELACYHDDFLGWANDMPALRDKRWFRVVVPLEHAAQDIVAWSIQPLGVRVFGNVAVVQLLVRVDPGQGGEGDPGAVSVDGRVAQTGEPLGVGRGPWRGGSGDQADR